jgi:Amt family ammonium transporter
VIAWFSLNKIGSTALLQKVDDTLGVLHTHGVAGLCGGLMVGIVANPAMIEYYSTGADKKVGDFSVSGLLYGNPGQLLIQAEAAAFIIVWNCIATIVILKLISFVIPLKSSDTEVEGGDLAIHGIDPVPYPVGAT